MTTIESSPEVAALASPDASTARAATLITDWFASTDHKHIGRLYLAGGLLGLLAAVVLNVVLAVERLDGNTFSIDSGALSQLIDAQRVALVFGTLLPLAMAMCVAVVPLQLGARAIAFPRLASSGFWMWFGGLVLTIVALVNDGGTLGGEADMVDLYIVGLGLMAVGLTASAGALATSVLTTRAPGMTMRRIPPFAWSALVFSLGILLVMPVFVGTLTYLFLDHRNSRTGFGGNSAFYEWAGWLFTQPATFLFAIPALGVFAEVLPVTFKQRMPARGVMFSGLALVGVAAFAGVTQQRLHNDPVPFVQFNLLPVLGMLLIIVVGMLVARPRRGMQVKVNPGFIFAVFGFGMILVGMLGGVLYAIDDLDLQGTVFEEATLIFLVYGAALGAMGAVVYWASKLWGRSLNVVFVAPLALLGGAATFLAAFPLYIAGFLGQPAGLAYADSDFEVWNVLALLGHALMAATVVCFLGALIATITGRSDAVGDDPWEAQTLEWATSSPAPRDNFIQLPIVQSAEPLLDEQQPTGSTDRSEV